jgi:sortase A
MKQLRNYVSWVLLAAGALFVLKGGSAVYPYFLPPAPARVEGNTLKPSAPQEGDYLAELEIPRLNATLYLVEGASENALRLGVGHLQGTPMPGEEGNSVIAGHRDTHFRVLRDIKVGDELILERASRRLPYKVVDTHIVDPHNLEPLSPATERTLTLITCYPFYYIGPAPKRFIVKAVAR